MLVFQKCDEEVQLLQLSWREKMLGWEFITAERCHLPRSGRGRRHGGDTMRHAVPMGHGSMYSYVDTTQNDGQHRQRNQVQERDLHYIEKVRGKRAASLVDGRIEDRGCHFIDDSRLKCSGRDVADSSRETAGVHQCLGTPLPDSPRNEQ